MVNIIKYYLIDSENVNDNWLMLLDLADDEDELVVFYTKNSPHMSYMSVVKLLGNTTRKIIFEECFEGNNALDFQLISYMGYLMNADALQNDTEYIVMSNDTGFDAAVKFWKKKGFAVRRINVNFCKISLHKQQERIAEETTSTFESNATKQELATIVSENTSNLTTNTVADITSDVVVEAKVADVISEAVTEAGSADITSKVATATGTADASSEAITETFDTYASSEAVTETGNADTSSEVYSKANSADTTCEAVSIDVSSEATTEADNANTLAKISLRTDISAKTEIASEETKNVPVIIQREGTGNEATSSTHSEVKEHDIASDSENSNMTKAEIILDSKKLPAINSNGSVMAQKTPTNTSAKSSYDFNKGEVDCIINCITKSSLEALHETLVHLYGRDQGQKIYKTVKANTYSYKEKSFSRKDKVTFITDIIFNHSELKKPKNFVDFLESNKNKTKNLNGIRAAITKAYGADNGMKYYSLFKPYFKIISAMK